MLRRTAALAACAALLAACAAPADTDADAGADSGTVPAAPTSPPDQRPVQARWWEWAAAEPRETNPVDDDTGADCARHQPADVWFLAGTFGGRAKRRCTVPLGVPLMAPALNLVGGDQDDCTTFMADAKGSVTLDGAAVPVHRVDGEPIAFTARAGNPVTRDAGAMKGIGCGLWAPIEPPGAGEHTVHINGQAGAFVVDVEYTLVISAA
jgi:hypothetical protein